jgi:hypothetical protein
MKKQLALAVLVLTILLVGAPTVRADDTLCVGLLTGPHDNIVVPPGAVCLLHAFVRGNVKALENSQLIIVGSDVRGNIQGDKAARVDVFRTSVGGNIQIKEGVSSIFFHEVVFNTLSDGNIEIEKNNVAGIQVFGNTLHKGTIKVEENVTQLFLDIRFNEVPQNLQVFKNRSRGNQFVQDNTVGENLQCFENAQPFVGGPNTAKKIEGQCF